MFTIYEWIEYVAAGMAIFAFLPYMALVALGKAKPKLSTWLVFFVVDSLTLAGLLKMEVQPSLYIPIGFAVCAGLIFFLALFKSEDKKFTALDKYCLAISAVGVLVYLMTTDGIVTMLIGLAVMFTGSIPTMELVWKRPEDESLLFWTMSGVAAILAMFVPQNHQDVATFTYPLVILLINFPIMAMMILGHLYPRKEVL